MWRRVGWRVLVTYVYIHFFRYTTSNTHSSHSTRLCTCYHSFYETRLCNKLRDLWESQQHKSEEKHERKKQTWVVLPLPVSPSNTITWFFLKFSKNASVCSHTGSSFRLARISKYFCEYGRNVCGFVLLSLDCFYLHDQNPHNSDQTTYQGRTIRNIHVEPFALPVCHQNNVATHQNIIHYIIWAHIVPLVDDHYRLKELFSHVTILLLNYCLITVPLNVPIQCPSTFIDDKKQGTGCWFWWMVLH